MKIIYYFLIFFNEYIFIGLKSLDWGLGPFPNPHILLINIYNLINKFVSRKNIF